MSRTSEIMRRYPPGYFDQFEKAPTPESLYPRFGKVIEVIESSLVESLPDGITRNIENYNWDGVDFGAHDHRGTIAGVFNSISLNLRIKGSTFDGQNKIGEIWKLTKYHQQNLSIDGVFISPDSRIGHLSLVKQDGQYNHMAFWLKNSDGKMELKQVVNSKGETYDASKLKSLHGRITIPGSQITIPIIETS